MRLTDDRRPVTSSKQFSLLWAEGLGTPRRGSPGTGQGSSDCRAWESPRGLVPMLDLSQQVLGGPGVLRQQSLVMGWVQMWAFPTPPVWSWANRRSVVFVQSRNHARLLAMDEALRVKCPALPWGAHRRGTRLWIPFLRCHGNKIHCLS